MLTTERLSSSTSSAKFGRPSGWREQPAADKASKQANPVTRAPFMEGGGRAWLRMDGLRRIIDWLDALAPAAAPARAPVYGVGGIRFMRAGDNSSLARRPSPIMRTVSIGTSPTTAMW